jgi:hypothetical protein
MEHETMELRQNSKVIEETHGENVLHVTLATGYLKQLLNNARIVRHLSQRQPEILAEFQNILEKPELGDTQGAGKE